MTSVLRRQGDYTATERPTVGDLKMSLVGVDHIGWLRCDGREVPIAAFRQLYDVVGNQFGVASTPDYFVLPNPEGRVLGIAGASPDGVTSEWAIGDVSGYETHTLTIPEMPAHNHNYTGGAPDVSGFTSNELTGISVVANGTHIHTGTTDLSGNHTHTVANTIVVDGTSTTTGFDDIDPGDQDEINLRSTQTTTTSTAGAHAHPFTTNPSGLHTHSINDPTHRHMIAANGGDMPHNNIQPTIWIGNLFVYSGRLFRDAPTGGNYFPVQGPPINVN